MNTAGVVQPGSSGQPGTLSLASYTQGIHGKLALRIGGSLPGFQYDVVKVSGPVNLSGILQATLLDSFVPKVGDKFNVIEDGRFNIGQLGLKLPSLPAGESWLTGIVGNFLSSKL